MVTAVKAKPVARGEYGEILMSTLSAVTKKQVTNLFDLASKAEKVDEHGVWEFGAEFDKKGRGHSTNWDLYAIGRDRFSKRLLIVVQIRRWEKQYKNGYPNIRKSYFLLGRNEDETVFAHPVESRVIHSAIKREADIIHAVQSWIFGKDYSFVIRQGDIAMVPVSRPANEAKDKGTTLLIQDSHSLVADEIKTATHLYAKNPALHHVPETHPDVSGTGWYKIVVGQRASFWDFAAPTID